jgi:hypothetical protein
MVRRCLIRIGSAACQFNGTVKLALTLASRPVATSPGSVIGILKRKSLAPDINAIAPRKLQSFGATVQSLSVASVVLSITKVAAWRAWDKSKVLSKSARMDVIRNGGPLLIH